MPCAEPKTGSSPVPTRPDEWVIGDPLQRADWDSLVSAHPQSQFFHTRAWARVLGESYGHKPFYVCRFGSGRLQEMLPLVEVSSPLTGRRGVSLPFTDFVNPLKSQTASVPALHDLAMDCGRKRKWRYLECRGGDEDWKGSRPSLKFYGHSLDLEPGADAVLGRFSAPHRRGLRKAQSERLEVAFGFDLASMKLFYELHCQTRRRHGLPPQPFRFFENIQRHLLQQGGGFIAIAKTAGEAVAAAVFFCNGSNALFKFGASNEKFLAARPNNLIIWEGIKRCAASGCKQLHLGRTSIANEGLRRFKLGFGAREEEIRYASYDFHKNAFTTGADRVQGWFNPFFAKMPLPLLKLAGKVLYPHLS
jgi:hypothetical protein